jgi:hypothetical protein
MLAFNVFGIHTTVELTAEEEYLAAVAKEAEYEERIRAAKIAIKEAEYFLAKQQVKTAELYAKLD